MMFCDSDYDVSVHVLAYEPVLAVQRVGPRAMVRSGASIEAENVVSRRTTQLCGPDCFEEVTAVAWANASYVQQQQQRAERDGRTPVDRIVDRSTYGSA